MNSKIWEEHLKTLLGRLPYLGLDAGIAASAAIAAWGLWCILSQMGGGA